MVNLSFIFLCFKLKMKAKPRYRQCSSDKQPAPTKKRHSSEKQCILAIFAGPSDGNHCCRRRHGGTCGRILPSRGAWTTETTLGYFYRILEVKKSWHVKRRVNSRVGSEFSLDLVQFGLWGLSCLWFRL